MKYNELTTVLTNTLSLYIMLTTHTHVIIDFDVTVTHNVVLCIVDGTPLHVISCNELQMFITRVL